MYIIFLRSASPKVPGSRASKAPGRSSVVPRRQAVVGHFPGGAGWEGAVLESSEEGVRGVGWACVVPLSRMPSAQVQLERTTKFIADYCGQLKETEQAMDETVGGTWDVWADCVALSSHPSTTESIEEIICTRDNKCFFKLMLAFTAIAGELRDLVTQAKVPVRRTSVDWCFRPCSLWLGHKAG